MTLFDPVNFALVALTTSIISKIIPVTWEFRTNYWQLAPWKHLSREERPLFAHGSCLTWHQPALENQGKTASEEIDRDMRADGLEMRCA